MKTLAALIVSLPEILRLIKQIEKIIKEHKTEKKVKDDLKKINEAFEKKDAKLLNDIFNSAPGEQLRDKK